MTTQIQVENIKCAGCTNSIKTALLKITNVQDVCIDSKNEMVNISSVLPFNRQKIVNQLEKMGYPEIGTNNLLHKAKSFVSCAIGNLKANK